MKQVKWDYADSYTVRYRFTVEPAMTPEEQKLAEEASNFPFSQTLEV
jgi:hypothetical protein